MQDLLRPELRNRDAIRLYRCFVCEVLEHFHATLCLVVEPHFGQDWSFLIKIQFDAFDGQPNQTRREERSEISIARQPGRSLIHSGCARELSVLPREVEAVFHLVGQLAEKLQPDLCDVLGIHYRLSRTGHLCGDRPIQLVRSKEVEGAQKAA